MEIWRSVSPAPVFWLLVGKMTATGWIVVLKPKQDLKEKDTNV